ncbi:putative bifunctional diguanylate cyclase/phosphodiesterase [Pilimelia columellifera]|uniref:Diguanylate cyclase/phosphodiesterase n=1 Tax=Pilimelia columellifera subsp. columellifera TaxID=706583 RepID=A0ABN3NH35_9ACTN
MSVAAAPHRRRASDAMLPALVSWAFLAVGVIALAGYALAPPAASESVFAFFAVGSVAAIGYGAVRNQRPGRRGPWWAIAAAMTLFLGGGVLRQLVPGADSSAPGPAAFIPDLLIVPGYILIAAGFIEMLRQRRSADEDPARADAVLLGIGAALAAWSFLIAPVIGQDGGVDPVQASATFFPLVDAILLIVVAQLLLGGGVREPVLWMIGGATTAMLAGDLLFALNAAGADGPRLSQAGLDLVFLAGFVLVGAAALHPGMRKLTEANPVPLHDLGILRTVAIGSVMLAPTVAAALVPPVVVWDAAVRVALTALLTAAIVVRIVRAHHARAQAQDAARAAELAERRRATHDSLTDLPNRELLTETITHWGELANRDGCEISLLFIDLDRFKMVNDNWGHHVGDELLCAVGDRLASMIRAEDIVCRIGGDEFVVALATEEPSALDESLARRVVAAFAQPFQLSVGEVIVTPSIGVARASGPTDALELIRDADTAMYQAKESGRNAFALYDSATRKDTRRRVDLEQALRGALERGELSLHYQPIIDLAAAELSGFEALLRWDHPQHGRVSPLDFVPIAEETGLIIPIGRWLLGEAVAQLARWRAARPAEAPQLHMSVNIAVRQLRGADLVEDVRQVLGEHDLPASALWLEITESGAMQDLERSLATLNDLNALGVTLCIDDFGTGYSSLSYLRQLPAQIVKIDRSFVNGVGEGHGNEAIVRAVLAMSHALGRQVVAEGVETASQQEWLRGQGCDLAQGYLYGAPRPADARTDWLTWPLADPAAATLTGGGASAHTAG